MKSTFRIKNLIAGPVLATALLGCGHPQPSNIGSNQGADAQSVSHPLAVKVDQMIQESKDKTHVLESRDDGFQTLMSLCNQAGGKFDEPSRECFCEQGGLFTTGTSAASCAQLTPVRFKGLELKERTGIYNSLTLFHTMKYEAPTNFVNDPLSEVFGNQYLAKKPFRISFVNETNFLTHYEPTSQFQKLWVSGPVASAREHTFIPGGAPFTEDTGAMYALYEPKPENTLAALGLDNSPLSKEQARDFSEISSWIKAPEDAMETAQILEKAYREFKSKTEFKPDRVSSPYLSQCASYCVASEELGIHTNSRRQTIRTEYKKVYQFGTPSTRTITLTDKDSNQIVAIIQLNVAETVASIALIHRGPDTEMEYRTYDRNWNWLYTDQETGSTRFDSLAM